MSQTPNTAMAVIGIDCANSIHGVAFLSWNQHPEPTGSRRATPLLLFQHSPGQFPADARSGIVATFD